MPVAPQPVPRQGHRVHRKRMTSCWKSCLEKNCLKKYCSNWSLSLGPRHLRSCRPSWDVHLQPPHWSPRRCASSCACGSTPTGWPLWAASHARAQTGRRSSVASVHLLPSKYTLIQTKRCEMGDRLSMFLCKQQALHVWLAEAGLLWSKPPTQVTANLISNSSWSVRVVLPVLAVPPPWITLETPHMHNPTQGLQAACQLELGEFPDTNPISNCQCRLRIQQHQ